MEIEAIKRRVMKFIKLITLAFLSVQTFCVNADFYSAIDSYSKGEFSKAFAEFSDMAKLGEKRAQFNLGVMHYHGQNTEKDINKAYAWMKLALESETITEGERKIFKQIESQVTDLEGATKAYQTLLSKFGTSALMTSLYPKLIKPENGTSFSASPEKVVQPRYPRNAAMSGVQGFSKIAFNLDKNGVPRNVSILESVPHKVFDKEILKAVKKWRFKIEKESFVNGLSERRLKYTMEFRLSGYGPLSVKSKVYERKLKQANAGDADAQFVIGFWQAKLPQTDQDANPTEWYLKSARQGHSAAQYQLGVSLLNGQGCIQENKKGIEWLVRAASNKNKDAIKLLGIRAAQDKSFESHKMAVEHFSQIEELDNYTKLVFARLLASSPYSEIRNPEQAIELVDDLDGEGFMDDISPYEVKGEAYAMLGDKKEALDMFEEALEEAEDLGAHTDYIRKRITDLAL